MTHQEANRIIHERIMGDAWSTKCATDPFYFHVFSYCDNSLASARLRRKIEERFWWEIRHNADYYTVALQPKDSLDGGISEDACTEELAVAQAALATIGITDRIAAETGR